MTEDLKQHVEALIMKAGKAESANEALHFSQAALNVANAMFTLREATTSPASVASKAG